MIIEVAGVNTANKGAELMLVAIQQHYARLERQVQFAVTPWFGSFTERAQYRLLQKMHVTRWGRSWAAAQLMPSSFRKTYGIVVEPEIAAVLDASGFAFGDQLPEVRTVAFAADVERWKRQGKRVVLLPQALGPFEKPGMRDAFRRIVEHADLIYARDPASHAHATKAAGSTDKIRIAPDITIGMHVPAFAGLPQRDRMAFIVPNSRMHDKMPQEKAKQYVPFLAKCVEAVEAAGLEPRLLLHDAVEDYKIGDMLRQAMNRDVETIRETDPLRLKAIIGQAHLLIGSRFHALVGALSQAVPAIAVGWSHKYEMLMSDFGCSGALLAPDASRERIDEVIGGTLADRAGIVDRLREARRRMDGQLAEMWAEVDRVLGLPTQESPAEPVGTPSLENTHA